MNGLLLGTSASVALPADFGPNRYGAPVEFDFAATIVLVPGTTYSLVVQRLDAVSNFALVANSPGNYAGGDEFVHGLVANADAIFAEGIRTVPEPSSFALIGGGGLTVLLAVRRTRRLRRDATVGS